ncbi:carboxylating nicotinate-nucleotide diphosphorylase [Hyphomicrobiales bacterium 4NK60-0047b]
MVQTNKSLSPAPNLLVEKAIHYALLEDLGLAGDITTNSIFNDEHIGTATLRAREHGILAGSQFVEATFLELNPNSELKWKKQDGDTLTPKDVIATIKAPVKTLLTGERVALNFLGHLTGIASLTNQYVKKISHTKAKIVDTRKTTPGLRFAEKYAVRAGGGENHRFRLDDAILIKDNHIAFAGGINNAIEKVKEANGHMVKIEVEVDTIDQLKECLSHKIDVVLLDNMNPSLLKEAVQLIDGKFTIEASGGVNLDTVKEIAETGVNIISVGALTHSATCLDLGLDIDITA